MNILQDIRFGSRMLAKSPAFTVVAMLALGLGIGVNSMMFTIYNAALFKSLPFEKPRQVVHITNRRSPGGGKLGISYEDFAEYRDRTRSFQALAAYTQTSFNISDEYSIPERVDGTLVTANIFPLIGERPFLGRDFRLDDEKPGADPVVVLSYGLWKTRYAEDPSIIGRGLKINDRYHTIVGVMTERMEFPETSRLWVPLVSTPTLRQPPRSPNLEVIGRLRGDGSIQQAQTELRVVGAGIAAGHPDTNKDIEPLVRPFIESVVGSEDKQLFQLLLGAATFVLLIACANVANLLLSRALHRLRETSIRVAVGASRWRVIRQLLIENILLSLMAGVAGFGFAKIGVRMFATAVAPFGVPYWLDWSMDTTAFLYLLGISLGSGIAFGFAPSLEISKANIQDGLKETSRMHSGPIRSRSLANALIIGEISLTVVLMVGGGLMIRSLIKRQSVDVGIRNIDNIVTMQLILGFLKYPQPADHLAFEQRLMEHLRQIRDIESVTIASHIPAGSSLQRTLRLDDRNLTDANGNRPSVAALTIEAGYFHALGLTMIRGREFSNMDGAPGAEAVIVNQRFAAEYWSGEDPIGKRIRLDPSFFEFRQASANEPWLQVIGVAPTIRQTNLRQPQVEAMVYTPFRQSPIANFRIIARSRSSEEIVANRLRHEVRQVDADLPVFNIMTLREFKDQLLRENRILTTMFSVFAAIALVIAMVGIYAVTAYSVSQRTQEIGVRMALGANRVGVVWLVLQLGLKQLAIGLPLGLAAAYGVSTVLENFLFQVVPADPLTFICIPVLLATIIVMACMLPARRAALLNPVDALRTE